MLRAVKASRGRALVLVDRVIKQQTGRDEQAIRYGISARLYTTMILNCTAILTAQRQASLII